MNTKRRKTLIYGSITAAIIGAVGGSIYSTLVWKGQQMAAKVQHGSSIQEAAQDQVTKMDQANLKAVQQVHDALTLTPAENNERTGP